MKKFFKKITFFLFAFYVSGELGIRIFHLNVIPPLFYKDSSNGLIKYYPDQELYYTNGNKFFIGANGNTGQQEKISDTSPTFSVIGDSYIEALMNPNDCHQSVLLQKKTSLINFTSRAISGASFIQMLEMALDLNHCEKIEKHLIYVGTNDFMESIHEIKKGENGFKYSLLKKEIIQPKINVNLAKIKNRIAIYFALPYYVYRKSLLKTTAPERKVKKAIEKSQLEYIEQLIKYIVNRYDFEQITLVLKPDTDNRLDDLLRKYKIDFVRLVAENYTKWSFEHDPHWNCYGHEMAAEQVYEYIKRK